MKEHYWVIAHDWGDQYPDFKGVFGFRMNRSSEIFKCTKKQAKKFLKKVKRDSITKYFLVKLKLKVQK